MQTSRRLLSSSTRAWRAERARDHWAERAAKEGLRSRAAFKLEELNSRFGRFLRPGAFVVDLGAAPGGFSVLAARAIRVNKVIAGHSWQVPVSAEESGGDDPPLQRTPGGRQTRRPHGRLVCVDIQDMDEVPGARFVRGDARLPTTQAAVVRALGAEADVVLSDLAPNTMSDPGISHLHSVELARAALAGARGVLRNGGTLVCKVFAGKEEPEFRAKVRECFLDVRAYKPKACRRGSVEHYIVAKGFVPDELREGLSDEEQIDLMLEDKRRQGECEVVVVRDGLIALRARNRT